MDFTEGPLITQMVADTMIGGMLCSLHVGNVRGRSNLVGDACDVTYCRR